MKHTYTIETLFGDKWMPLIKGEYLQYCLGWMDRAQDQSPRPAYRLVRSDGRIQKLLTEREDVSIGQVAGFPTAEQYEAAAQRALEKAAAIRENERLQLERSEAKTRSGTWGAALSEVRRINKMNKQD
jgi:hypothetical protein